MKEFNETEEEGVREGGEKRKVKFLQGYPMRDIILARETGMCTLHIVQVVRQ